MFRTQPVWHAYLKFCLVLGMLVVLGVSSSRTVLFLSMYGICVLSRSLVQIYLSEKNNREIQINVREQILKSVEKGECLELTLQGRQKLMTQQDYRKFRALLFSTFPHFRNSYIWNKKITQVFFDLGFSSLSQLPPVHIEVPVFRPESATEVAATLRSLSEQSYPAIQEILICFNDPENQVMERKLRILLDEMKMNDKRMQFISIKIASKRAAMYEGFQRHVIEFQFSLKEWLGYSPALKDWNSFILKLMQMTYLKRSQLQPALNSISVNIDADTIVDPDAVSLGVLLLLHDPQTTAITSNVEIRQSTSNFLSLLTFARYKSANVTERAAQSALKTVRCMSGPFMMFWTRNLLSVSPRGEPIVNEWVSEKFLNVKVEPGDDRSWTVRHNEQGFGVSFHPDIYVTTDCPISWQRWCKQQLRWMRSGNRNFIISLPFLFKLPIYIIFDDLYLFCFPFLLLIIVGRIFFIVGKLFLLHAFQQALTTLLPYILIIVLIHFVKSCYLAWSQKNWKLLWLSLYFLVYVRYLVWLRILSLLTISESEWTGRSNQDFSADQVILKGGNM